MFWLVAVLESGPVRATSLVVRVLAWLLLGSAVVLAVGPGDASRDPGRAVMALLVAAVLWVVATVPRWLAVSAVRARPR